MSYENILITILLKYKPWTWQGFSNFVDNTMPIYLDELKQHMVQVGWCVGDGNPVLVFKCWNQSKHTFSKNTGNVLFINAYCCHDSLYFVWVKTFVWSSFC